MLKAHQDPAIDENFVPTESMASEIGKLGTIYMSFEGDGFDKKAEIEKLKERIAEIDKSLRGIEVKLGNPNFVQRAKPEVVKAEKAKHAEKTEKLSKLTKIIASLGG